MGKHSQVSSRGCSRPCWDPGGSTEGTSVSGTGEEQERQLEGMLRVDRTGCRRSRRDQGLVAHPWSASIFSVSHLTCIPATGEGQVAGASTGCPHWPPAGSLLGWPFLFSHSFGSLSQRASHWPLKASCLHSSQREPALGSSASTPPLPLQRRPSFRATPPSLSLQDSSWFRTPFD